MEKKDNIGDAFATVAVIFLIGIMISVFTQCSPKIIKEVYTQVVEREIHDTTTFEIPVIVEKNVTKDTVSHLENTYGKSDAVISEGLLHHSLETIPQVIKVPFEVTVTDTLIVEKEQEIKYVEVEKELTKIQKMKIDSFWGMFLTIFLCLLWIFRKQIVALIKKIL